MLKRTLYILLIYLQTTLYSYDIISDDEVSRAIKGGLTSTKRLLQRVPIDYVSRDGDTLLHYAVRYGKGRVVEHLVDEKILISRKGGSLYGTALEEAIYYGHLDIASYLIDRGTYLNIRDIHGDTPLHIATKRGYLNIVEKLIANGASKSIANRDGKIPYDLIPELSWDSRERLRRLLKPNRTPRMRANPRSLKYINREKPIGRVEISIDGRSRVEGVIFGIDREGRR